MVIDSISSIEHDGSTPSYQLPESIHNTQLEKFAIDSYYASKAGSISRQTSYFDILPLPVRGGIETSFRLARYSEFLFAPGPFVK